MVHRTAAGHSAGFQRRHSCRTCSIRAFSSSSCSSSSFCRASSSSSKDRRGASLVMRAGRAGCTWGRGPCRCSPSAASLTGHHAVGRRSSWPSAASWRDCAARAVASRKILFFPTLSHWSCPANCARIPRASRGGRAATCRATGRTVQQALATATRNSTAAQEFLKISQAVAKRQFPVKSGTECTACNNSPPHAGELARELFIRGRAFPSLLPPTFVIPPKSAP